jgi:hypothetical protein
MSSVASLQFDVQGFFDSINHTWLIQTFCQLGFAKAVCEWLSSFLKDCTVQLRFNRFLLDPIDISVGAPQGSPLSPVLSIIYIGNLLCKAESWHNSKLFIYINDGNILVLEPSYRVIAAMIANRY